MVIILFRRIWNSVEGSLDLAEHSPNSVIACWILNLICSLRTSAASLNVRNSRVISDNADWCTTVRSVHFLILTDSQLNCPDMRKWQKLVCFLVLRTSLVAVLNLANHHLSTVYDDPWFSSQPKFSTNFNPINWFSFKEHPT